MAGRFVALISPRTEGLDVLAAGLERQHGFARVTSLPNLIVLTNQADRAIKLPRRAGAIVGVAFSKAALRDRVDSVDDETAIGFQKSQCEDCLTTVWGGYVAIIRDYHDQRIYVLRDPSGNLPSYYHTFAGVTLIASDVDGLLQAGMAPPQIDWEFLARHFLAPDLRCRRTGLSGVFDLQPGFRLTVASDGTSTETALWSPSSFALRRPATSEDAAQKLREVVEGCVGAWGTAFPRILLSLSGGFDSSVIAAALSRQTMPWSCQTMATDEPEGDERPFAHLVAERYGVPLSACFHRLEDIDVARAETAYLPRPNAHTFGQSQRLMQRQEGATLGAGAFFQGLGGDNVFCFSTSAAPLLDRLLSEGPSPGSWDTLCDVCQLTGASVWEVGASTLRMAMTLQRPRWRQSTRFLTKYAVGAGQFDFDHPWQNPKARLPPGRRAHIAKLLMIFGTVAGFSRPDSPDLVAPLLSQPVVEYCLGVSSWEWVRGGRDRALARRAFADNLPLEIVRRRTKGNPDRFAFEVAEHYRDAFRHHLLGGLLVEHRLIDRDALAKYLDAEGPLTRPDHLRLQMLAEAESWVRHWHARQSISLIAA